MGCGRIIKKKQKGKGMIILVDEIITNFDGSTINRSNKLQELINYYNEAYGTNLSDICDLSEGSEIRTFLESFIVESMDIERQMYALFEQTFTKYATGYFLDLKACEQKISRKQGNVATGTVTFTLSETQTEDYTIPQGTVILHRQTGNEYILSSDVTIQKDTYSADGIVYSRLLGSEYNAEPDTLTAFEDIISVPSNLEVTNNAAITEGESVETDDSLRERIYNARRERANGTITAYTNMLLALEGVHDVSFVNPSRMTNHYKTVVNADGTTSNVHCTDCTRVILVNDENSKPCRQSVLENVENVMTNQDNIIIGHMFHVQPATVASRCFDVTLYYSDSRVYEKDVVDAITAYFDGGVVGTRNFTGLNIGEDIRKSKMITAIEEVPGVDQVESIVLTRYNKDLPTNIKYWTKNSATDYSYQDTDGFVYHRGTSQSSINRWGSRNFNTIPVYDWQIASFISKTRLDPEATNDIGLTQYPA